MSMIDSHCHLNDDALYSRRKAVLSDARAAGVSLFLCVGWDLASSRKAVAIAHEEDGVYAAVGIHPENLDGVSEEVLQDIRLLSKDPKVIAIGEIGLDYHWFHEEKDQENQKKWFVRQLDLANEVGLPVSIHARDASQDTYDILLQHPLRRQGVLHCYTGSSEMLPLFAKLGFYFGFDGPITYSGSRIPKQNVRLCPADRLLSETDSPYLPPAPHRGMVNEPKYLPLILSNMATLRNENPEAVEAQIQSNFRELFHVEQ